MLAASKAETARILSEVDMFVSFHFCGCKTIVPHILRPLDLAQISCVMIASRNIRGEKIRGRERFGFEPAGDRGIFEP
jgi:hypothetical protein